MQNPFSLSFGNIPQTEIKRIITDFDVVSDFNQERSTSNAYMITGVRGSGKTVYMTDLCNKFKQDSDWIVLEISPESDILTNIAYRLSKHKTLGTTIVKTGIDLSILNFEMTKSTDRNDVPISLLVEELLTTVRREKKKVLIAIDEAVNNKYIKEFAHQFQIYIRAELPIYLLMTGLYENIYEIQNEKTLTFLYRTPRIEMKPLKTYLIKEAYEHILSVESDVAQKMAELTKGYPFAYQVLGFLYFEDKVKKLDNLEQKVCNYLGEYVYDKIWSEMSEKDREVVFELTKYEDKVKVKDFREKLNVDSSKFSHYRDRLKRKGVIDVSDYGYITFSLPMFKEYILKAYLY